MILTNMDNIPGKEIEYLNMVNSSVVFAKNIGRDIMASLKNMVGGELKGYSEMLEDARARSLEKLQNNAKEYGADAIVNIRYTIASISQGSAIAIVASGTAVKFK